MSLRFLNKLPAPPLSDENDENNPAAEFALVIVGFCGLELRLVVIDVIEFLVGDILRCGGSRTSSIPLGLELLCVALLNLELIVGVTLGGVSIGFPF